MKIFYMTFGCKVNSYETQNIEERFMIDGHSRTNELSQADVCVINSCTVTAQADSKLRHFISRARRENPKCLIVLAGCFPQAFPNKAKEFSECDIICGTKDKGNIPELVYKFFSDRQRIVHIEPHGTRSSFEPMCNSLAPGKTRAFMKIQDGCDIGCTYCVIPRARGHICSKPLDEIRRETELLARTNHKEIVLTGINICCYGCNLKENIGLADAVETVASVENIKRVRLGSIEPEMLSENDIERMAATGKLCPQFHLSLQSGCNKTLKAMHRRYDSEEYYELCRRLRAVFPNCAITTDIMVGFPGENENDHMESLAFAEKTAFASAHIFPYSRREGTLAYDMPEQVDNEIKARRAAEMKNVCKRSQLEYNTSFVGKTVEVLFEREGAEPFYRGHTPEYLIVKVPRENGDSIRGEFRNVLIVRAENDFLIGDFV